MFKVKHCVVTSSVAAIRNKLPENRPADNTYSEKDWSDTGPGTHSYAKSKTLAERAGWDYHSSLDESERFDLTMICPAYIVGPAWPTGDFASGQILTSLMMPKGDK